MNVYIASHCQIAAQGAAMLLMEAGHMITSRWIHLPFKRTELYEPSRRCMIAVEDEADVTAADIVVLIAGCGYCAGGKFVEAGIAIGQGKRVIVIGRRENMMMWHPLVTSVPEVQDAIAMIGSDE